MRNSAIESIDCSIATGAVVAQIIENAPKSLKKKKKKGKWRRLNDGPAPPYLLYYESA